VRKAASLHDEMHTQQQLAASHISMRLTGHLARIKFFTGSKTARNKEIATSEAAVKLERARAAYHQRNVTQPQTVRTLSQHTSLLLPKNR